MRKGLDMNSTSAHRILDASSALWLLTEFTPYSLEDASNVLDIPRPTLSRIRSGKTCGKRDVSGLCTSVIREVFATDSEVAVACQLMEHELRQAAIGGDGFALLTNAQDLHDKLVTHGVMSEDVDQLALVSLAGQISLYGAQASRLTSKRKERYQRSLNVLLSELPRIERLFTLGNMVPEADRLLGLRMLLNAFFAAWSLDEIEGAADKLPRARKVASRILQAGISGQSRQISERLRDPRIAYQTAEVAALVEQHRVAATHLADAILLSGGNPTVPRAWKPHWLTTDISGEAHFVITLTILEKNAH